MGAGAFLFYTMQKQKEEAALAQWRIAEEEMNGTQPGTLRANGDTNENGSPTEANAAPSLPMDEGIVILDKDLSLNFDGHILFRERDLTQELCPGYPVYGGTVHIARPRIALKLKRTHLIFPAESGEIIELTKTPLSRDWQARFIVKRPGTQPVQSAPTLDQAPNPPTPTATSTSTPAPLDNPSSPPGTAPPPSTPQSQSQTQTQTPTLIPISSLTALHLPTEDSPVHGLCCVTNGSNIYLFFLSANGHLHSLHAHVVTGGSYSWVHAVLSLADGGKYTGLGQVFHDGLKDEFKLRYRSRKQPGKWVRAWMARSMFTDRWKFVLY
eukprot:gnl/Trimastix_PCT/1891.p1 GENE.gnl/Trimastix_PCT/1891~~gnl/Trimastix_PCT/1891.p1  ORF type:complete len:325 (+),score=53.56 gnl/Trimastix_PCT/1891:205-1179(+)